MIRKMKPSKIWRREQHKNDYMETIKEWHHIDNVEMFIYTSNGDSGQMNDVQSIQSTHVALTAFGFSFVVGDKIEQNGNFYTINYVTQTQRYQMLSLEACNDSFLR